ncbi:GNAT family N-acetyltransferase [Streptomyces sp. NBC_01601]|uniref:GNAT family N-acetyltransferase n=1 Tax=Streptomyces sp. NBC_01601 TaxID=2975892 RepID=UPI002E2D4148|nr:GNAT family N-acetyltransferase [Streptomyces sp. NBC_01601]
MSPSQKPPALYVRIANDLRTRISAGEFASGPLPTETSLAEKYATTRVTVRKGLDVLIQEGLIYADRPRGHFVRVRRPMIYRPQQEFRKRPLSPEMDSFLTEMTELGREASQTIEVSVVPAPPIVRERLHLEKGELTAVRRRVRFLDGEPYLSNDSYFPRALVKDSDEIMNPADIARGANVVLAELGYQQVRTVREYEWGMPDPAQSARLGIPAGTPITEEVVTGYTAAGQPVRCVINCLPGDRIKMVLEDERPRLSSELTIAPATPKDLETVTGLWEQAGQWLRERGIDQWQYEPRTDRIRENIAAGECFLVHDDGIAVATITVDTHADPDFWNAEEAAEDALYVHRMVVRRDASGEELGSALLDWASTRAEAQGKRWLRLDAWRTNQGLLDYYRARGCDLVRTVTAEGRQSGALFQRPAGRTRGVGPLLKEATGEPTAPDDK